MRPSQGLRPDVSAERAAFADAIGAVATARLVFVDESGVWPGMRSGYGYARRGRPCVEHAPYRKGRRLSLIGWVAPGAGAVVGVEGSVDRATFERFVVEHLAPCLEVGDVVVWDNHSIHKGAGARAAVEARGARLLAQPRYSPECNAVELLWSKLKRLVRGAGADTAGGLHEAVRAACGAVREQDMTGWVEHVQRLTPQA